MTKQLRAIVGARVSVVKGAEKVSHIAQHGTGQRYAEVHEWSVVDTFQDLDVSATVSPFDRPDLGPWFTEEKLHEWDAMIFAKIDRAFRSIRDCVDVARWCEQHRKILVFADDGLSLNYRDPKNDRDLSSMMAELFIYLGAFFAQIELKRFQGRALDAHSVLRTQDRWAGGIPPGGFKIVPHPSGKGKTLAHDPARQKILHEAAELLLGGETFNGIAKHLTEKGYETTRDYFRRPDKKRGLKWSAANVIDMLTSQGTQGIKLFGQGRNTRPVLDNQGNPIQIASPSFDDHTWRRIQQAAKARQHGPAKRVNGTSPLLDVVFCHNGHKASQWVTENGKKVYRYYRCSNNPGKCLGVNARANEVEAVVEETFLAECGDAPVFRRVFVPGEDHTEELEQANVIISSLRDDREMGLIRGDEDEARFRERMSNLLDRRAQLEALPQRTAGWRYEETGETYGDAWVKADVQERRKLLVDAGVRFIIKNAKEWEVQIPEDIKGRLQAASK